MQIVEFGVMFVYISGVNLTHIMDAAVAGERTSYSDMREKTTRHIVYQIDKYLRRKSPKPRSIIGKIRASLEKYCCWMCNQMKGSYLVMVYLLIKIMYLVNAIGQLFLLNLFLGQEYQLFGIEILYRLFSGRDWSSNVIFPKVTLCSFEIRHMTQLHKYIVQCALPVNIFNEKLFIFIWFWYVCLSLLTLYSFLWWCCNIFYMRSDYKFIKRNITYGHPEVPKKNKQVLVKFTEKYLQRDGLFILRLLAQTAGVMSAADIVCGLWDTYGADKRSSAVEAAGLGTSMRHGHSRSPSYSNFQPTPVIRITREEI